MVAELTLGDSVLIQLVFKEGKGRDLRFFRDRSSGSDESSPNWTHVGIEYEGLVWHAFQGRLIQEERTERGYPGSGVIREPLASFLDPAKTNASCFYGIEGLSGGQENEIIGWCGCKLEGQTPFDYTYDFSEKSALYCTEFVWEAFRFAGITLCEPPFSVLHLPFVGDKEILLPVELTKSEKLVCLKNLARNKN